jgi:hypothetical protein
MKRELIICGKPVNNGVNYNQLLIYNEKTNLWEGIDENEELTVYTEEDINNIENGLRNTPVYIYYILD